MQGQIIWKSLSLSVLSVGDIINTYISSKKREYEREGQKNGEQDGKIKEA